VTRHFSSRRPSAHLGGSPPSSSHPSDMLISKIRIVTPYLADASLSAG
jgi:hypothetical protein